MAEAVGYDHIWIYDPVETVPRREPAHLFEAFTTLAALSQCTKRVGLGQLVTCAGYRNVGLLAKEAACIDVFSGGRLTLGIGAGWYHEEYASYGYDHPYYQERIGLRHRRDDFPRSIPEGSSPAEAMAQDIAVFQISEPLGTYYYRLVEDDAGIWWWNWPLGD